MNQVSLPFGLLAITCKIGHADFHWRVGRVWARLQEQGVDARVCWLDADEMPAVSPAGRVVVLQRTVVKGDSPDEVRAWIARLKAAGALAVVFEIDDDEISGAAIAHRVSGGGVLGLDLAHFERERQQLLWTLNACDGSVVSTDSLATVVKAVTDKPVIVVPNSIDEAWFLDRVYGGETPVAPLISSIEGGVTIGWAGHRRPETDLEPMAQAWGRIARRYPRVMFTVAGYQADCFYREIDDLDRIVRLPWVDNIDLYPSMMRVDIGCVAVADSPFSRCKSPIKAWEFYLAGAAVIGSRSLYQNEVQFHAETADEWENHLSRLIDDEHLRDRSHRWGVGHVREFHVLASNLGEWADAYSQIVRGVSGKIGASDASV